MGNAAAEIEGLISRVLGFLQSDRRIRMSIAGLLVASLLGLAGRSVYGLVPRHYTLSITGGDIVNSRHYLARILQAEAPKKNLTLIVRPEEGMLDELQKVSDGAIDLAFIQGGMDTVFPHVEHVATVAPEMVHLLARPPVQGMADLRGHSVNLGPKDSGERDVGLKITQFAGYVENVDYVETNYTPEQLLELPAHKMPDVVLLVSSVPSYLAELLVRDRQYDVKEIPFPDSLALRYGWATDGKILSYTYDLNPPVPAKDIQTVAVNLHLVSNARVDPAAIEKLLEVLYSPSVINQLRQPFDESKIAVSSGYPISAGMTAYLTRNQSIFTLEMWQRMTSLFGLVMSFGGMGIVLVKWFRGAEPQPVYDDDEFHRYLLDVAAVERSAFAMEAADRLDIDELKRLRDRLGALRVTIIERYPRVVLKDSFLFDRCIATVRASHEHVGRLIARGDPRGAS
jgi:TRAP-type uncharacterized transport system substrate-binding protein